MVKQVAKMIIEDDKGCFLFTKRSDHPTYPLDPDLPGGTLDPGENPDETVIREVYEETNVTIDSERVKKFYVGDSYSAHGTIYHLYYARLDERPEITISWEHDSYEWLEREVFLEKVSGAKDTYMHMVHDVVSKSLK